MEFRLALPPIKSDFSINHEDKLLIMGSCFTENIGNLLLKNGFSTCINPFGIIYNPISIFKAISNIYLEKRYTNEDLDTRGDIFFSYDHHGSFSEISQSACLAKINSSIENAHAFMQQATTILITPGTSFVYELTTDGRIVANCHKLPAASFHKRLLTKEEIVENFNALHQLFPNTTRFIFTVSPVRHWRDGAVENTVSKSILHTAIHEITSIHTNCYYFPAYELMMDDLRDYRFYADDMLHPNELAIAYSWERFSNTYFTEDTRQLLSELQSLHQAMEHRPLFPESADHQKFSKDLEAKKTAFLKKYPFIQL